MATILQSEYALRTKAVPQAFTSGAVVAFTATVTIPAGTTVATTDVIEFAVLPADHRIVDAAIVEVSGFTTETADIGIMSGEVGDDVTVRTSDDKIFDGVALTGFARLTSGNAMTIATDDTDRSIGLKFSAKVVGAGQKVSVQFLLTQ